MFLHNVLEKALLSFAISHTDTSFWWRRTWITWWSSKWEHFEYSSFRSAVKFANGALDGTFNGSADGDGVGSKVRNLVGVAAGALQGSAIGEFGLMVGTLARLWLAIPFDWRPGHSSDYWPGYHLIDGRGTQQIISRGTHWIDCCGNHWVDCCGVCWIDCWRCYLIEAQSNLPTVHWMERSMDQQMVMELDQQFVTCRSCCWSASRFSQ